MVEKKIPKEEVLSSLKGIGLKDFSREYETFVAKQSEHINVKEVDFYMKEMENLIEIGELDDAYNLFYALCTFHRRRMNISLNSALIRDFSKKFSGYSSFKFLKHLSQKGDPSESAEDVLTGAKTMLVDIELMRNNGVMHSYCECVAEFLEDNLDELQEKEAMLKEAIDSMAKVTSDEVYPKFYCTYGRLLALMAIFHIGDKKAESELSKAVSCILKAIDLENTAKASYSLTINQYQTHILNAKQRFYSTQLKHELIEAKNEFEEKTAEMNVKNMEFLAFFIGVISFTLGSLNLATFDTFADNARLIIVLMGALMVAFSCFGFILYGFEKKSRILSNMAVAIAGFILIFIAPFLY